MDHRLIDESTNVLIQDPNTMADDGMFMNFSVDENIAPPTQPQQKFKGGSWRDRLKAKRSAERVANGGERLKRRENVNNVPLSQRRVEGHHGAPLREKAEDAEDFSDPRPTKRRRENGQLHESRMGTVSGPRRNEQRHTSGPREVISSLFTYNPQPSTAAEEPPTTNGEEKPTAPSNAPLIDGIDTFTSLGLSPTIAAHLLTKMNLKGPTAVQKAAVSQMLKDNSDAFIQSETGSGKTLAYLLPLVQRIMTITEQLGAEHKDPTQNPLLLHRDSGLFAIIMAPTRELCKQISVVVERLLGCARYIVAGHVIGGEKKKSEKAHLRKGINILVATPGRLVDHFENTKALDISNVRWLVLDEGDRLMDLGFEEDITKILNTLDARKRPKGATKWPGLPDKRTTVLCSATLKTNVQKLGEISLKDAILIKGEASSNDGREAAEATGNSIRAHSAFLAPAQLKQSYIICAAKLRFVTLIALLKRTFVRKGSVMKAIVFHSCADSVDFHFKAFTRTFEDEDSSENKAPRIEQASASDGETASLRPLINTTTNDSTTSDSISSSPTLSTAANPLTIYKLHGSLPQQTRTAIITAFTKTTSPSLLLATDVASRGLDLPNLDLVIEYDPAFSAEDHLHRIGRTARLGRDGRAVIFLLPGKEEGYVSVLKASYRTGEVGHGGGNVTNLSADSILKKGFTPTSGIIATKKSTSHPSSSSNWEQSATLLQLSLERWISSSPKDKELARKAFQSHVRAYATHTANEREYFDIKELHLGHLCKSFGLRETPSGMGAGRSGGNVNGARRRVVAPDGVGKRKRDGGNAGVDDTGDTDDAARKMREKIRMNRKMMTGAGADEFNIA